MPPRATNELFRGGDFVAGSHRPLIFQKPKNQLKNMAKEPSPSTVPPSAASFNILLKLRCRRSNGMIFELQMKDHLRFWIILTKNMEFKCPNNSLARVICISNDCMHCAFDCQSLRCCSPNVHASCKTMKCDDFVNDVDSKFDRLGRVVDAIKNFYNSVIHEVEKDIQEFQSWAEKELQLKKSFFMANDPRSQIRGTQIACLLKEVQSFSEDYECEITAYIEYWQKNIKKQLQNIKEVLFEPKRFSECQRNSRNGSGFDNLKIDFHIPWKQQQTLTNILDSYINTQGKSVDIKRLYTATKNEFSVEKFHEACDGRPNTLVLIHNSKGKMYGGFTPCPWQSNSTGVYRIDPYKHSFVFNINQDAVYPIFQEQYAIQCHTLFGPIFGRDGIIMIESKADKKEAYWQDLPTTYRPESGEWSKQLFKDFMGVQNGQKYTVVEWEVFEIVFQ